MQIWAIKNVGITDKMQLNMVVAAKNASRRHYGNFIRIDIADDEIKICG